MGACNGEPYFEFPWREKSKALREQISPTPSTEVVKSRTNRVIAGAHFGREK